METLLEAQQRLEDRWLPRATMNNLGNVTTGKYGNYRNVFIHKGISKEVIDAKSQRWSNAAISKVSEGTHCIIVKNFNGLSEKPGWEIYFPSAHLTTPIEEANIAQYVSYEPYDLAFIDQIRSRVPNDFKVMVYDRSSYIDTAPSKPYYMVSISSKSKDFKCSIRYNFWEAFSINLNVFGVEQHSSLLSGASLTKHLDTALERYRELDSAGDTTFLYEDEYIHLSKRAMAMLSSRSYLEYYIRTSKWVLSFSPNNKTLIRDLGKNYPYQIIEIPQLKRTVYALLPVEFADSEIHKTLLKNKRKLNQ